MKRERIVAILTDDLTQRGEIADRVPIHRYDPVADLDAALFRLAVGAQAGDDGRARARIIERQAGKSGQNPGRVVAPEQAVIGEDEQQQDGAAEQRQPDDGAPFRMSRRCAPRLHPADVAPDRLRRDGGEMTDR